MDDERVRLSEDMDRVYRQYVKPLEQAHTGEHVLVTPDGRTVLAPTLLEIAQKAHRTPSEDNDIFKVGEKVIGVAGAYRRRVRSDLGTFSVGGLGDVCTDPRHRNRGVATRLVAAAMREL